MQSSGKAQVRPESCSSQSSFVAFFKANCAELFQTALLLSGDIEIAEASIIATIKSVNMLRLPEKNELTNLHHAVALQTVKGMRAGTGSRTTKVRSMLQAGLWPVLEMEQTLRACFVLRILLRYDTPTCARILGMEEAGVQALLPLAISQLHDLAV